MSIPEQDCLSPIRAHKGRGAVANPEGRFAARSVQAVADGWSPDERLERDRPRTEFLPERAKRIVTRNESPDVPFDRSVNPYRGCEHGCVYCYARPAHAYVDLSPGLDFETRLFFKAEAATLLRREFATRAYQCRPLAFGTNTDPYQPLERKLRVMRSLLEVCDETNHPLTITTRGVAILDDIETLARLAARNLVSVAVSLTTLDDDLKRIMEPRAPGASTRLSMIRALTDAGVPTSVMTAPIIPAINDAELESLLEAAATAGARSAGWILVRLPNEVASLFEAWLAEHFPERASKVLAILRDCRGGRLNDPRHGTRMRGQGVYADLIEQRFRNSVARLGLDSARSDLDTTRFCPPDPQSLAAPTGSPAPQLALF